MLLIGVGFFYLLWLGDTSLARKSEGKCPRCGIDLAGIETENYYDGAAHKIEYAMCVPCAKKSKKGPIWLWIFCIVSFLIVMTMIWHE